MVSRAALFEIEKETDDTNSSTENIEDDEDDEDTDDDTDEEECIGDANDGTPNNTESELVIPSNFICPLTLAIMKDPLISRHGQNYERRAIMEWIHQGNATCPMTRQPLRLSNLITNHSLKVQIEQWKKQNINNNKNHKNKSSSSSSTDFQSRTTENTILKKKKKSTIFGTVPIFARVR